MRARDNRAAIPRCRCRPHDASACPWRVKALWPALDLRPRLDKSVPTAVFRAKDRPQLDIETLTHPQSRPLADRHRDPDAHPRRGSRREFGPFRHADGHGRRGDGALRQAPEIRRLPPRPGRTATASSCRPGHGSMLLYSLLYLTGDAEITLDEIKNFRQLGSQHGGPPRELPREGRSRRRPGRWVRASPFRRLRHRRRIPARPLRAEDRAITAPMSSPVTAA